MINYSYNLDLEVLEVSYEGEITLKDLVEYGDQLYLNKSLPRELRILTDATKAIYKLNLNEVNVLIDRINFHMGAYKLMKVAVIHSKPVETAYSVILKLKESTPNYIHRVFSSHSAALEWLLE